MVFIHNDNTAWKGNATATGQKVKKICKKITFSTLNINGTNVHIIFMYLFVAYCEMKMECNIYIMLGYKYIYK